MPMHGSIKQKSVWNTFVNYIKSLRFTKKFEPYPVLSQQTDEYYENLTYRFLNYINAYVGIRSTKDSEYVGFDSKQIEKRWLVILTSNKYDSKSMNILFTGYCAKADENVFEKLLERVCADSIICHTIVESNEIIYKNLLSKLRQVRSHSISELDLKLTVMGY